MKEALVSILIPVYNRQDIIIDSLKSASNQTYKNIEIIVVDNCSTDDTLKICNEYAKVDERVKVYKNDENIGPVKNWIKCVENSNGEYVKILWSDDWMDNDYIEECLKLMIENVAFVFTPAIIHYIGEDRNVISYNISKQNEIIDKDIFIKNSIIHNKKYPLPVSPGCALFRKNDLNSKIIVEIENEEGLIFNRYGAGNDLLMFLLTAMNSKYTKVAYCNETIAHFRAHKDSFSISNDLEKYYDYSKAYFINKVNYNIRDEFKSLLFLKRIKYKNYDILYKYAKGNIKIEYLYCSIKNKLKEIIRGS